MSISFKSVALAVPFAVVLGAVYWVGSTVGVSEAEGGKSQVSSTASHDSAHMEKSVTVSTSTENEGNNPEKRLPQKVQMTEEEKKKVLTEFFSAAERDVERMEMEISKAKLSGMALADVAEKEEKLAKMRQVIQQVKLRNPGY